MKCTYVFHSQGNKRKRRRRRIHAAWLSLCCAVLSPRAKFYPPGGPPFLWGLLVKSFTIYHVILHTHKSISDRSFLVATSRRPTLKGRQSLPSHSCWLLEGVYDFFKMITSWPSRPFLLPPPPLFPMALCIFLWILQQLFSKQTSWRMDGSSSDKLTERTTGPFGLILSPPPLLRPQAFFFLRTKAPILSY